MLTAKIIGSRQHYDIRSDIVNALKIGGFANCLRLTILTRKKWSEFSLDNYLIVKVYTFLLDTLCCLGRSHATDPGKFKTGEKCTTYAAGL